MKVVSQTLLLVTVLTILRIAPVSGQNSNNCTAKCENSGTCFEQNGGFKCYCGTEYYGEYCELPTGCKDVDCLNGGSCENKNGSQGQDYQCICPAGYEGKRCEQADLCILKNPQCINQGVCSLRRNGTEMQTWCKCPKPFFGERCELGSLCTNETCKNRGKCSDKNGGTDFECICEPGYDGKRCEQADLCILKNPNCTTNGVCSLKRVGDEMKTKCKCLKGFYGEQCEFINNCLNVNCGVHGKCENIGNASRCTCAAGFTGDHCEIVEPTTPYSHAIPFQCFQLICQNGGTCVPDPTQRFNSKCYCGTEYYGDVCQFPTACKGIECFNGGLCENKNGSQGKEFECVCPPGYEGLLCQERDLCKLKNPNCSNGYCSLRRNGTEIQTWCKCQKGFHGTKCELENLCTNETCKNVGVCKDIENTTECRCKPGFSGLDCSKRNPCYFENDCENGLCKRLNDFKHNCTCQIGFYGPKCQFNDSCLKNPCLHNGTCERNGNGRKCVCPLGFAGVNCQVQNPCLKGDRIICLNSGKCKSNRYGNSTVCDCPGLFIGPHCKEKMKKRTRIFPPKCKPNSCNYHGNCTNAVSSITTVTCKCNKGFNGTFCNIEDLCITKYVKGCKNGGRCFNATKIKTKTKKKSVLLFSCRCKAGFSGLHCERKMTTRTRNGTGIELRLGSNVTDPSDDNNGTEMMLPACNDSRQIDNNSTQCNKDDKLLIPYVVGGCLLAYLIFFIILAIWDHHNHVIRPKVIIMCDINKLREETFYLILVETGNNFLAGSTANVCCQLYGEKGRSKEYVLSDKHLDTTRQNGYDTFLVSSKKYLGRLEKIRVWHDNYGHTASWFCRQIIVRDIKTDEFWIFFIHRWLTIYMDRESLICRKLVATNTEVEHYLQNRFTLRRYWQRMREHHLWMCPLTCPPRSTYFRIERLTSATAVLFMYMLILIFLYGTHGENSIASMDECGVFDFEVHLEHLAWPGFVAAIIGLFLGFIIVLLFRRIRKERIPAIIASDRTKELEDEPDVKPGKVTKKLEDIYRNQKEIDETDSEGEIGRWDNLDPDRVMVVGIAVNPETKKYVSPPALMAPPLQPIVSSSPSSVHFFSIPSTDMLQTERWISGVMDQTHGAPTSDDFVRHVEPDKNRIPVWKQVVDLGLIAQVNQMRNEDPSSLIYQSSEPIDDLIRDSIRDSYEDGDSNSEIDESENILESSLVEPLPDPEHLPLMGGGEIIQTSIPNVNAMPPSVRNAKIQTDTYIESNVEPLPKFFQSHDSIDDDPEYPPPKEDPSETNLLRTKSSVVTIKQFVNPAKFLVELGEIDYDYENYRMIPRKYIWIPWLLCILIILICAIVTIIYGLRYSYVPSLEWCTSLVLAVIISCVFLQPLTVLVIFLATPYFARKHVRKFSNNVNEHLKSREEHRIFNKFKLIWIIGPRGSLKIWPLNYITYIPTFFQPPLSGVQIFMNKLKVRRKAKIRKSLIDFIIYSVFILLVIWAGDLSRDNMFYHNMRTVEDILLLENDTHILHNKAAFRNIRDEQGYMNNVFIPAVNFDDTSGTVLRSEADYCSTVRTKNRETLLLGVPRIRQLRVSPGAHNCKINDTFRPHCNQDFYDGWDYSNKDTSDYSEGWEENVVPRILSGRNDFWRFNGAEETQSIDTAGELDTYDGSGYIAELGQIQSTSLDVIEAINSTDWIDERTRVILVELSLYNPNLNIHSVVILLLEKAVSLQYLPSSQVRTWRFPISAELDDELYVSTPALYFAMFIFSLCLLHFFIFTVVSSIQSFRQIGISALRQFLLWVDICIITIGITAIWNHFVNSTLLATKFIELRSANRTSYVSFQIEEERQERQIRFFSILITLGIVKLWYLLVVSSRIFFIIGFTSNITGPFVLGCILILNILLLGFCVGAVIVFGEIRLYRTIGTAILTQIYHAGLRNIMPYYKLADIAPVFGRVFFFGFTVFVVLLFINVMASVITLGMQEAKETSLQRPFRFSYFNYIWLKLQLIIPDSIRKKFESRYNDPLLTQEREEQMERTLIPILWNHIYSIPVRRIQEMKSVVEELVEYTDLIVVSKKDKEIAKKLKILKIEEGRVNRMRELAIRYIKEKLKIDFEAPELAGYNNFNFSILQLKCKKLDQKMNDLDETIGKYDLQKLKYLKSNKSRQRGSSWGGVGPWESDSETDATARLK